MHAHKFEAETAWGGTVYALLSRNQSWQPVSLPLRDYNVFPHSGPVRDSGSKAGADPVVESSTQRGENEQAGRNMRKVYILSLLEKGCHSTLLWAGALSLPQLTEK